MHQYDSRDSTITVRDGLNTNHVEDALRISYDAFKLKFRIGFRNADDYVRLFRDQVNIDRCITATVNGELGGILTVNTRGNEFYKFSVVKLFSRFSPFQACRILFNLAVMALDGRPDADEFVVETLVVHPDFRGMGIGTKLLQRAEAVAATLGKHRITLGVIEENDGARRLYERCGYKLTNTQRGFPLQFIGTSAVHTMEKSVTVNST